jgi:hypothetical protein
VSYCAWMMMMMMMMIIILVVVVVPGFKVWASLLP